MNLLDYIDTIADKDPSWYEAYSIVRKTIDIPTHVSRLFRGGWSGEADVQEYFKVVGFSRLNPKCLISAANVSLENCESKSRAMEQALFGLGVRLSAVVLAINFVSRKVLAKKKTPVGWKSLFQEMITGVEIGYRFGAKIHQVGIEGGALMGYIPHATLAILMANDADKFKKYINARRQKKGADRELEVEIFGCERYQIAAALLQQLGFGPDIALGAAFGMIHLKSEEISKREEIRNWEAACKWITSLHLGRNYPGEVRIRNYFSEVKPGTGKERNLNLEVLHTEISKVRKNSSEWTWHLPQPGYEETREALNLP